MPVRVSLIALAAIALSPAAANAESFNCALAKTPTEHAICDNPQISTLDEQMAGFYYRIISSGAPAATVNQVKSVQVNFLAQRNTCGAGYHCLIDAYTSQIMYLRTVAGNLGL